jgi:pimeloyl-ACP methyl ester carboxylesterase
MALKFLQTPQGERLAYKQNQGAASAPTVIWCGGLKSDMEGSKALHLHSWARRRDVNYIRFDYFGHGLSSGAFTQGTLSRWAADVSLMIDRFAAGKIVLVGSSMGGWASLLAAAEKSAAPNVSGLVLINPAPDFTEKLTYAGWDEATRAKLETDRIVYEPSGYEEPYAYSKALIEDGRARQILDAPIDFGGPVEILQGEEDAVVPWEYSRRIMSALTSEQVRYTLVKGGDHSLSRETDLALLTNTVERLLTVL